MVPCGGVLLLVNAAWNLLVWPPFLRRVRQDPRAHDEQGRPTRFLVVHAVITATAALLGLLSLGLGVRLVRAH